jgi:undecaprenyl-diphosphatase
LYRLGDRLAGTPPVAWVRRRWPTQLAWLRRRLEPAESAGLALTAVLATAALAAWIFAGLTEDVSTGDEAARLDPGVHAFAVAHRTHWLTAVMAAVTWLGSGRVLVPVLVVATIVLLRRHDRREVWWLWAAYLGSAVLYGVAKVLVDRPRPAAAEQIGAVSGLSFPSGHATQAIATWGMLAVVASATGSRRHRGWFWAAAGIIVLLVGVSRVYLGAHWYTDVLAGYALGATWLALLSAIQLRPHNRQRRPHNRRLGPRDHADRAPDRGA